MAIHRFIEYSFQLLLLGWGKCGVVLQASYYLVKLLRRECRKLMLGGAVYQDKHSIVQVFGTLYCAMDFPEAG